MPRSGKLPLVEVSSLADKLNSQGFRDLGRIYGIEKGMQMLRSTVQLFEEIIHRFSENATDASNRELRDALHAADEFFDDIATQHSLRITQYGLTWKVRSFFSYIKGNRIHRELDKINNTLLRLSMDWFSLPSESPSLLPRVTSTYVNTPGDIVGNGRSYERNIIIEMLMEQHGNEENVSFIAVVGVAGNGKTTLAKMACNDSQVKEFFDVPPIWVHVSQNFVVENIVKQILTSMRIETYGQETSTVLLNMLEGALENTKYLLVLDDVCDENYENWTPLMTPLMSGAQGSKILLTTRSQIVAKNVGANTFHLTNLNAVESLYMLDKMVFGISYDARNLIPESVRREIVTKCRGDPELIAVVANMLSGKLKESEWINVLESDFLKLTLKGDPIMKVLNLSYQHLQPPQLKQCFIYCCVYPKGWNIEKNELIQLWMAQGYLEGVDDAQEMEDVGNEFVDILERRNLLVMNKKFDDDDDNLESLKIHDLLYDFALLIAGNDFYVDTETANTPIHMCFLPESNNINLLGSLDASKLQSFFLQRANDWEIAQMRGDVSVISRCKGLRLLNLSHSSLKKLPDLTGELKHLRYLDLSWCVKLVSLPKSICNLVNLQTLKLTGCEKLEFSTNAITNLINLRHLEIRSCKAFEDMMPAGLEKLSSLQSLSNFFVVDDPKKKTGKLNELQNLNSLRGSLEISTLDQVRDAKLESQNVNLKDKKLLESLDLNWDNQDNIENSFQLLENLCPHENLKRLHVRWYPGDRFSNWLSRINNLSHISLFGFNNCKSLPPIEHLPNLKSIEISSMKVLEYIYFKVVSSHTEATFFPSLKKLKFSGCGNFKGWKSFSDQVNHLSLPQFRRLSQLTIKKCPKLTYLPTFPNVEELQFCESTVKPLKETLNIESTSSSVPLSLLKSLRIEGKLAAISILPPKWKQRLTSLKSLEIGDVDDLDIWFEDHFTSLQKVVVYGCDQKALPQKMCNLLSLQHIKMMGCHKLASLPKEMSQLTNLVTLEIWDCPLLVERCQRETGEDWPQISHVSNKILKQNLRL